MTMINKRLSEFIECHEGLFNRLLHVIGLILIVIAVFKKNMLLLILGGLIQEFGHFYQYWKTKNAHHSPWYCSKSQILFAYPVFIALILYILFA